MLPQLNRTAVIVRPKEAFLAWATEVFASEADPPTRADVEEACLNQAPSVYLLPETDIEDEAMLEETMSEFCELIFDSELEAWCEDTERWPADLGWEAFQEWFEWDVLGGIFDTFDEALTLES